MQVTLLFLAQGDQSADDLQQVCHFLSNNNNSNNNTRQTTYNDDHVNLLRLIQIYSLHLHIYETHLRLLLSGLWHWPDLVSLRCGLACPGYIVCTLL